jgi:hypothetical protein
MATPSIPQGTSPWGMRLQFVLLFRKLIKEQEEGLAGAKIETDESAAAATALNLTGA